MLGLLAASLLIGAGLDPRLKVTDYPVHAKLNKVSLGAEYLVRSFSGEGRIFVAPHYLVVEVALYPSAEEPLMVAIEHFTLRLNGKKQVLFAQAPGFVAASLKYPDWEPHPKLEAGGGIGDTGVIVGRPEPVERFPGDQRPRQTRLPRPPQAPSDEDRSGLDNQPGARVEEVVVQNALPEGKAGAPVSGYLYFPYKSKTKTLRSLELVYQGPAGVLTLRLFSLLDRGS